MSGAPAAGAIAEPPAKRRIQELLAGASVELSARDRAAEAACRDLLAPGTRIFINFAPNDRYPDTLALAARLRRDGFAPVPHIVARYIPDAPALGEILARARGEAGVEQVLVIAGDRGRPVGAFDSALQLIEAGLFAKHGVRRVGISGYPEGHPRIATATLEAALRDKLAALRSQDLAPLIVTQFCFEASPILDWTRKLRAAGIEVPVHVGLAGPATVAGLTKFALRCGIGNSLRALARQGSMAKLLTETGPERIIYDLSTANAEACGLAGFHFFTFGGIVRTGKWLRAVAAGRFDLSPPDDGFRLAE
ncbi:MAG TPA: methylenetetrahydrofolate reductase [Stellaceae bacterium]|nr:methylenetetrahydrofolate reductase [Stellaceae bacterium]